MATDPDRRAGRAVGLVWVAMTLTLEFSWGRLVEGLSWATMLADYDLTAGRIWVRVLICTALAPVVVRHAQAVQAPVGVR